MTGNVAGCGRSIYFAMSHAWLVWEHSELVTGWERGVRWIIGDISQPFCLILSLITNVIISRSKGPLVVAR